MKKERQKNIMGVKNVTVALVPHREGPVLRAVAKPSTYL